MTLYISVLSLTDIHSHKKAIILLLIILGTIVYISSYDMLDLPSFMRKVPKANFTLHPKMYPPQLSKEQINHMEYALIKASENQKIIIDWYPTTYHGSIFNGPCGNCLITANRSLIDHPNTSAVLFHFRFIKPKTMPHPRQRRPDQLYVWKTGEAPPSLLYMSKKDLQFEDTFMFNATFSHRRDSDIQVPYGSAFRAYERTRALRERHNPLLNKTKLAIAAVSNCGLVPGAVLRVEILQNISRAGLNIDLLGRCFENQTSVPKNETSSFQSLLRRYKFYFSFENSYHCRDYVTEKVFQNALEAGAVPVVWGPTKTAIENAVPPKSFIFVEDYSYDELVDYINYLDKNNTAYLEYFRWYKMDGTKMPGFGQSPPLCQLCRMVHGINVQNLFNSDAPNHPLFSDGIAKRTVPSISKWYFETENEECKMNSTELRSVLLTRKPGSTGNRQL